MSRTYFSLPKGKNAIRFRWDALDEARRTLRKLTPDLHREGGGIVLEAAQAAYFEIRSRYPEGPTGNLRGRLSVIVHPGGRWGLLAEVNNRAPHAHLFERGTKPRFNSFGAYRGIMPAGDIFVPTIRRHRGRMHYKLQQLLKRQDARLRAANIGTLRVTETPGRAA